MGICKPIVLLCLLVMCAGCGGHPKIRKLSASSIVLAFGDSLTSGTGASQDACYPSVLAARIGCRVVNAGESGENTTAGLLRLPGVLEEERPDLVILCHGGNDLLRGVDPAVTIANLNAMIDMVKNTGADVILIAVPRPALRLKPASFYREIASGQDIPFLEDSLSRILSTPALTSDPAHPNAAGYQELAKSIESCIRDSQRN